MKKLLLLPLLMLLQAKSLFAQDTSIVDDYKGGFLHFYLGSITNNSYNLRSELNNGGPFGGVELQFENINTGPNLGLGTMLLFDKGVMLGVKADYSFITNKSNNYGRVKLNGLSAEFLLGKSILNRNNLFIYPYLGIGFYKYFLNVENQMTDKPLLFDPLNPLKPGEARTYSSNYPIFELGMGFKKTFSKKVTVGVDLGIYFSSTLHSTFKYKSDAVEFRSAPGLNGAFVKFSFDLLHYGGKNYIDTTRKVFQAPIGGPEPVKKPEEEKKEEKKKKKEKEIKAEEKKEPEKKEEEKKAAEEPAKQNDVKDNKAPKKKAKSPPKGRVNPNEQLFNFGNQPANAPAPSVKDTTKKITEPPPAQIPDTIKVQEPK